MKSLVILLLVGLVVFEVESDPQNFGLSTNSGSGRRFNSNFNSDRFGSGNRFNSQSGGNRFNSQSGGNRFNTQPGGNRFNSQSTGNRFNTQSGGNRFNTQSGGNRFNSQSNFGGRFNDFSHGYDDIYGSGSSNFGQTFTGSRGVSNFGNTRGSSWNRPSYQGRTRGSDMFSSYSNIGNYGSQSFGGLPAWMWLRVEDDSLEFFDDRRKRNTQAVASDNTAAEVL
ncbi:uncharacterized protein [Palaemon carinicauda]|uniref:uncharacterized protein n=1 Tax=Palaemon carinicauda TaxID=392227 RepID=UPI0035B604E2